MKYLALRWMVNLLAVTLLCCLAGRAWATPLMLQQNPSVSVTASKTYGENYPRNAADDDPNTVWNSGAMGPQWIQLDFGKPVAIQKLNLLVAQSPEGDTIHEISVGTSPTALTKVWTFSGHTKDNQWLSHSFGMDKAGGNVRYLRITTTQSKSWVAWKEIEVQQGVEYFGYFFDAAVEDFMPETTAAGANLVWVAAATKDEYIAKLQEASSLNAKAILYLNFFKNMGDHYELVSDAELEQQWLNTLAAIRAVPGSVAALYPMDEPYEHGVLPSDLQKVANLIRADLPDMPIAVIVSRGDMNRNLTQSQIAFFDWVGYDCYQSWDSCNNTVVINMLRNIMTPNQRMIAVPWAYLPKGGDVSDVSQNEVVKVISRWHKEILSDPSYIAVTPFLWQDFEAGFGARDFPPIKNRLKQMAKSLLEFGSKVYPVEHSASSSYAGTYPFYAFDGDGANLWSSGSLPSAWVQADFAGSTFLAKITLRIAQNPSGITKHVLEGFDGSSWSTLGTFTGNTSEGRSLTWSGHANVNAVRVTTTQGPSWVAWHDIAFSTSSR